MRPRIWYFCLQCGSAKKKRRSHITVICSCYCRRHTLRMCTTEFCKQMYNIMCSHFWIHFLLYVIYIWMAPAFSVFHLYDKTSNLSRFSCPLQPLYLSLSLSCIFNKNPHIHPSFSFSFWVLYPCVYRILMRKKAGNE